MQGPPGPLASPEQTAFLSFLVPPPGAPSPVRFNQDEIRYAEYNIEEGRANLIIGKYSRALVISANIVFEKEDPTQRNSITIIHEAADGEVLDTHVVEDDTTGMVGNLAISTIHDEVQPGQRIVVIWTPRQERITFNNFHVFNTATAEPTGVSLDFTNPRPFETTIDANSFPTGTQEVILTLTAQGAGGGGGGGAGVQLMIPIRPQAAGGGGGGASGDRKGGDNGAIGGSGGVGAGGGGGGAGTLDAIVNNPPMTNLGFAGGAGGDGRVSINIVPRT
jgi:hypothetical protein